MHNSFDMLNSIEEIHHGEATLVDETLNTPSERQLAASQVGSLGVPLETASLITDTVLKSCFTLEIVCPSHDKQEEEGSGRLSFPKPPSPSIDQVNNVRRMSFPNVAFESVKGALDVNNCCAFT